jgi:hypothetical protein
VRLLGRLARSRRTRFTGPLLRIGVAVGKTVRSVIKAHLNLNIREGANSVKHVSPRFLSRSMRECLELASIISVLAIHRKHST